MTRTAIDQLTPLQLPIRAAARLLSYDARTITRLVERGELQAVGQGKLRRIVTASLHAYQQRHLVEPTQHTYTT
jgi:excisionase family DNA binding protein